MIHTPYKDKAIEALRNVHKNLQEDYDDKNAILYDGMLDMFLIYNPTLTINDVNRMVHNEQSKER